MTDSIIPLQFVQKLRVEDFTDQSHSLMGTDISQRSLGIADHDSGRFLSAVLQGQQSIVQQF